MHPEDFFDGVGQADINLGSDSVKLPIFYRDGEVMMGIFPAHLGRIKQLLPDRSLTPARLAPGVGAMSVTCFEYRDSDVGSYNELAIGAVLSPPGHSSGLPMQKMLSGVVGGQIEAYVQHLPVTTELARVSGREIWNFPKFVTPIDFEESGRSRTCHLTEDESRILSLEIPKLRSARGEQIQLFANTYQDGQPQRCEFKLHAERLGRTLAPGAAELTLGREHPIAKQLARTLISTKSLAAAYSPSIIGILYGPQNVSARTIQLAAAAAKQAEPPASSPPKSRGTARSRAKVAV